MLENCGFASLDKSNVLGVTSPPRKLGPSTSAPHLVNPNLTPQPSSDSKKSLQLPKTQNKPPKKPPKKLAKSASKSTTSTPSQISVNPPSTRSGSLSIIPFSPAPVAHAPVEDQGVQDEDGDSSSEDDEEVLCSDSSDLGEDLLENPFGDSSEEDDDAEFDKHVDRDVFDENLNQDANLEEDVFNVRVEDDDYGSHSTGDEGSTRVRYPQFNPLVDFRGKVHLCSGMKFGTNEIFRKALRQFAIENDFDFYYLHNDSMRVSAYCMNKCKCPFKHGRKKCKPGCKDNNCGFRAKGRRMCSDGTFQMKTFVPKHECGWQERNTKVTSIWLADKYLEHYRDDPQWRIKGFIASVRREHSVNISYHKAWRARVRALLMTQGYAPKQYAKVYDYAAEILKRNLGSSLFIKAELGPERPIFQRLYVCLDACKRGFLAGCRPVVGLDGCHLKGAYTEQVLTAVSMDGDQHIFPVTYAVVEPERKETWVWFLENLMKDIGGKPLTFMSDRQKGLLEAIATVAPTADTRVCVRHLHNNFKDRWSGQTYKDAAWAAAKAATISDFKVAMGRIRDMDPNVADWLMRRNPQTWSLHGFKHYAKSDMLLNNACESFNKCILEARELPILSMCEWIRRKLMNMFVNKRNKMKAHQGLLTPEAAQILNKNRFDSVGTYRCFGDDYNMKLIA